MTGVRATPGYIRIVEDGYNLFCIKFRVRKVRRARFAVFGRALYIRIRVVFPIGIYRAPRAPARFSHYYVAPLRHASNINPSKCN